MWHKDVNDAGQDHRWSDGRKRKSGWGEMTQQHRGILLRGDSKPKRPRLRGKKKKKT